MLAHKDFNMVLKSGKDILFNIQNATIAHLITTGLLVSIGGIGMWKGLEKLDSVEKYTISLNLGMISARGGGITSLWSVIPYGGITVK